ncbi:MAG: GNAT family N-acetyltransferase [Alphaproteobacteria bacterium]|nr:GNAT family N-acetyltransferase [Alphaproteobacteria bacterium]
MTIRAVRLPDDEPAILSFIWGLQKFENAFEPNRRLDPGFAGEHWADVRRQVAQRGAMFMAEAGGHPVGWVFVVEEVGDLFVKDGERRYGFIAELFVEETARGAGHGRALIAACEDWSRGRGMTNLIIGVLSGNDQAAAVYHRDGFAPYNLFMRKYL